MVRFGKFGERIPDLLSIMDLETIHNGVPESKPISCILPSQVYKSLHGICPFCFRLRLTSLTLIPSRAACSRTVSVGVVEVLNTVSTAKDAVLFQVVCHAFSLSVSSVVKPKHDTLCTRPI